MKINVITNNPCQAAELSVIISHLFQAENDTKYIANLLHFKSD